MSSLLRSTKFVRYFTGAARTLILNTAKTAEVNTLVNPKALCAFNNVGIRDYATKKAESLEPLLQRLDSEVRRFGRISKRDIDEVFDELRGKNDITSSQSLLVIRCCGELVPEELPEQRTLLVQKIWSVLTERGVPMDISHYNALLRVYLENEHPFSPAKFLEELEKKGLQPNRVTYQRLMWRYCQEGDVEGATKVLEKMRELNFPVSEPVLNALVMGHAFHGDTDGAKAVLQTMAGAGLEPSNRTYTLIACGYAKKGDIDGVNEIIQAATAKDTILTDKDILEVIEHLALGGHGDKVEQLFAHLQKGVGYNQDVCNLILRLLNKGHETTAKKIMKTMPKTAKTDDTMFKGAFFVKQLLRLNKPPEVLIKACKELKEENLVPNAIFIATDAALQQGQVELAQELFKELKQEGFEIREHFYWPLLAQKGKEGDEEGLMQIIRNMVSEGLPPTGEALRDYVIPYLIGKDTEENILLKLQIASVPPVHGARNLMVELLENGKIEKAAKIALLYRPRGQYSLIARSLLTALNKTKDIDSFVTILHVTSIKPPMAQVEDDAVADEVKNDDRDVIEVGRIVKTAVNNLSKPDLVEKLLTEIHSKGLRISTNSAEEIEQYLGQNMSTKLSELLLKLTSPDLEPVPVSSAGYGGDNRSTPRTAAYLESLLNQLKKKNVPNLNRIQKQLLHAYIKENNLEKVQSYLEELKAANFDLNVLTLAQLFEFYCENDQIDKALQIQKEIAAKDPEFELNKFKAVQMAYALVRVNKFEEAVKFLKENSSKDEFDSFMYNSKCWQLLNTIAEQKNEENTIEITNVMIDNDFMKPSNVVLGPSIKVFLLNDNLEGALKRFEECCKLYRSTPWKGELMKALIMKEDATKLQWLADLSTQIHGEVNILHDLVLAFVECGRLRQARRILETPGMHARQRRLEDACQRYVEENKPEYLEGLLEATKELSNIDRSNIFYHLLVSYCKANDTDKALSLWTLLQEEGEVPSSQFLNYLGRHLKSKKRPVPFVMSDDSTAPAKPDVVVDQKPHQVKKTEPKPNITKKSLIVEIESLVKRGKTTEGMDFAIKAIKEGQTPKPSVMKFLLKTLADEGNVEKIQELEPYLNEKMKRDITYDDKLTRAVFMRGGGADHVEKLSAAISAATTPEDLEKVVRKFPRSNALATVIDDDAILKKCHTIAEAAASKGNLLPANLLWMECLIAGKDKEAASLWSSWLSKAPVLVFRRLLQEAHTKRDPELMQKLVNALLSNKNLTPGSVGNAYSRLIGFYVSENRTRDAVTTFEQALKNGVDAENLNKNCIVKLRSAAANEGIQINQQINEN